MALFASPNFYQSSTQNISAAIPPAAGAASTTTSNYFPHTFIPSNNNTTHFELPSSLHSSSSPHDSVAMKRRREADDSEPLPKRRHYEERMSQRFDSLDLSNENPLPPIDIMEDELEINEIDPEILSDSPQSIVEDLEEPIIEEPEDEDRIVLSDELHRYMKNANEQNILSKFIKKPSGNEIVLWRPLISPSITSLSSSSTDNASGGSSSMNDRIIEVIDEEEEGGNDIQDISDGKGQNNVTFPDESSSSARSSCSPPKIITDNDPVIFESMSSSSSSCCSSDGNRPSRMPSTNLLFPQNQPDYEPMEMD
uniref:Uncharacterized protein n=1 Tax=Panagrolaimus sp. ES5 TaxID=591445 RepID=A0AC34F2Q6_9BILA